MTTPRKTTRPNHMTPAEREECVALYENGATLDRLAEIFDRGRCTIERLIARRGVKRGDKFRHTWKKGGVPLSVEHREKLRKTLLTYYTSITTQENKI